MTDPIVTRQIKQLASLAELPVGAEIAVQGDAGPAGRIPLAPLIDPAVRADLNSAAVGDGADMVNFSGKTIAPDGVHVPVARTISGNGGFYPANTPLLLTGTMDGTGSGFIQSGATVNIADEMALDGLTPGATINALYVNLGTVAGAGAGSRNAIHGVLGHYTPTNPAAGQGFKTAIFGTTYVNTGEGGVLGGTLGDFYSFGGIVTLKSGATHVHGCIGAEFDVAVETGASVDEKIVLQVVTVNSDAVQGSVADAMIAIMGDGTTSALVDYGIAFGKPGARHVAKTLIGGYSSVSNGLNSVNGLDLSNFTFSGNSIKAPGFTVTPLGTVEISNTSPQLRMNDTGLTPTTGGLVRLTGSAGSWQFQINTAAGADFSTVIAALSVSAAGVLTPAFPIVGPSYTFATLPSASPAGRTAFVSDSSVTTYGTDVAGGGANFVSVFSTGSAWKVG